MRKRSIPKPIPGVGVCAQAGLAYIADAPKNSEYWAHKDGKYFLVTVNRYAKDRPFVVEVDKNGKLVKK